MITFPCSVLLTSGFAIMQYTMKADELKINAMLCN